MGFINPLAFFAKRQIINMKRFDLAIKEIYFDKEFRLTDEEVFVDCGGYTGETSLQFIARMGRRYKKLVIFELEDLFEIPILLRKMRNDYRLLIQQYSDSRFETVCYAI